MPPRLTFLFVPIDAVGHFNACIGIGGQLLKRGHKVVFATPQAWKGKLGAHGFIEEVYSSSPADMEEVDPGKAMDKFGAIIAQMAPALAMPADLQARHLYPALYQECFKQIKYSEQRIGEIVKTVTPDVIVVDNVLQSPSIVDSGIPWILSTSLNPVLISRDGVPPGFSGLPADADPAIWETFANISKEAHDGLHAEFKQWLRDMGGKDDIEYNFPFFHRYSPWANIYQFPIEMDYVRPTPPPKWHRFDAFVRETEENFEIPAQLKNLPGKLIYVSMGTIGCAELGLMKRLMGMLANSPNRFIVSKGPLADKYELPDNMWGAARVPQTKVLPLVDLVITHGGNNTITEAFYFGTKILVLPLFCDQHDNGQRIHETGLGMRFMPYQVEEDELLEGIEFLLKDELLDRRMKTISKRIQSSNSQAAAADLVERIAIENKK